MSTYTNNGITFNDVTKGSGLPSKYGNSSNKFLSPTANVQPFVNAVELDWNGANLGNEITDSANLTTGEEIIIKTTGQLLSYMSVISQKITNLENILMNL